MAAMRRILREIDIPPLWLGLALALAWATGQALPLALPLGAAAGRLLIGLGLALMGVAVLQMVLRHTTFIPRRDPSALVTGGAFRLSRNPIYLGDALILAGAILIWDAALALPLVPAFTALITRHFILGEEARIAARFGAEFDAYRARTRRWI